MFTEVFLFMEEQDYIKFHRDGTHRIKMRSNNELLLKHIRSHFSVPNTKKEFMKFADDKLSPISLLYSFCEGFTFDVIKKIKELSPNCIIDISEIRSIINPLNLKITADELIQPENETYQYRFYQEEVIISSLKYGRGVIDNATGAGKSLAQYGIIINMWKQLGRKAKVLMIVPTVQLVCQMHSDFLEYGCDPSLVSMFSAKCDEYKDTPITISNRDFLLGRFGFRSSKDENGNKVKKKNDKTFITPFNLNEIEILLLDECHGLSDRKSIYSNFITKVPTKMKFGFSGSIPDKTNNVSFMEYTSVIGTIGSVIHVIKPKELQELGILADLKIAAIQMAHTATQPEAPHHIDVQIMNDDGTPRIDEYGQPMYKRKELDNLERAKMRYPLEWDYIEKCKLSNEYIAKFALKLNGNSIILYDHNIHGDQIIDLLNKNNDGSKQIFLIYGEVDVLKREDIRKTLEKDSNCVLVANTKCFSVGINVKNIRHVVFAFSSGNKAPKIIQSIGRGLRLMTGKVEMWLYDFYHNYRYSNDHYNKREKLYLKNYNIKYDDIRKFVIPINDRWI